MHTYLCIVASGKCVIFCLRGSYDESAESILQYTVYTCETCVVFVVGSHSSMQAFINLHAGAVLQRCYQNLL